MGMMRHSTKHSDIGGGDGQRFHTFQNHLVDLDGKIDENDDEEQEDEDEEEGEEGEEEEEEEEDNSNRK